MTLDDLRAEGFPEKVVEAVDVLTRRPEEPYELFIFRAASHDLARIVKMADLLENCDLSRIPNPGPKDFERLKKYQHAIQIIRCMFSDPPTHIGTTATRPPQRFRNNWRSGLQMFCLRKGGRAYIPGPYPG